MKKLIILFIFAIAMIFASTSCTPLFSVSGTYDPNDSYYIETSPYYHHRHYYVDYYYDRHSSYYQKQHINRNEPQRGRNKSDDHHKK
jgi:hypothetical protein